MKLYQKIALWVLISTILLFMISFILIIFGIFPREWIINSFFIFIVVIVINLIIYKLYEEWKDKRDKRIQQRLEQSLQTVILPIYVIQPDNDIQIGYFPE